jgi:hypothetical protein
MDTDEDQERHRQENTVLREQARLQQEKIDLQQQVEALQVRLGKDSHNSLLSPSSDRFHRRAKSLRKKSDNKRGQSDQPG